MPFPENLMPAAVCRSLVPSSRPTVPTFILVAVASACASFVAGAQTAPPAGVGIYLSNAVVGTSGHVGDGDASYATGPGVSIYNGGGTQIEHRSLLPASTSAPLPLGATTGTLSSSGSSSESGGRFAQVTATADLSGGVLRASAVGSTTGSYDPVGPGAARGIAGAADARQPDLPGDGRRHSRHHRDGPSRRIFRGSMTPTTGRPVKRSRSALGRGIQ